LLTPADAGRLNCKDILRKIPPSTAPKVNILNDIKVIQNGISFATYLSSFTFFCCC